MNTCKVCGTAREPIDMEITHFGSGTKGVYVERCDCRRQYVKPDDDLLPDAS